MTDGQMTTEEVRSDLVKNHGYCSEEADAAIERLMQLSRNMRESMSPPESLCLPPELERVRWQYGIPDAAFDGYPAHDRVMLYRPESMVSGTFVEGGVIVRSPKDIAYERQTSHRGLIVGWGLKAQDELVPQGYRLGDMVSFVMLSPYMKPLGVVPGTNKQDHVIVLRAGHVIENVSLEGRRRSGEVRFETVRFETERKTVSLTHTIERMEKEQPLNVLEEY